MCYRKWQDRAGIQGNAFCNEHTGGLLASSHSAAHTHKHRKLETELQAHRPGAGWQPVLPCFLSVFTAQFHFHFLGSDSNVVWLRSSLYITGPSRYSGDGEANENENWHCTNHKVGSPSKNQWIRYNLLTFNKKPSFNWNKMYKITHTLTALLTFIRMHPFRLLFSIHQCHKRQ